MGERQRDRLRDLRPVQRDLGLRALRYRDSVHSNFQRIAVVRIAVAQRFVPQHRSQRNGGLRRGDSHGICLYAGLKAAQACFLAVCAELIQRQRIAALLQRQADCFQ